MEQEFLDKLEAMDLKDHAPTVEKGLLDLPADLMYEVFGPLDARSLLETAVSHRTLRKHVALWPGKQWDFVFRSGRTLMIDNDIFQSQGAGVLLQNAVYNQGTGSEFTETSTNICDLPYDLLLPILKPLDVYDMMSVAKCHPNLVRATRKLKDKCFNGVQCFPEKVVFLGEDHSGWNYRAGSTWTPGEAEILLADAFVVDLLYDVQTPIAPNMRVRWLAFKGAPEYAHKCAGLIEKWKPESIIFPEWDAKAFNSNAELPRVLKNVERLVIGAVTVEWLSYIPEWKFTSLSIQLDAKGENVTPQLALMCQQIYAQWMEGSYGRIDLTLEIQRGIVDSFEVGGKSIGPRTRHIFVASYRRFLHCKMLGESLLCITADRNVDDWMYYEDDYDFDSD